MKKKNCMQSLAILSSIVLSNAKSETKLWSSDDLFYTFSLQPIYKNKISEITKIKKYLMH